MDTEVKNIIPFIITQKMKCLRVNLTKHTWDLHAENHKTLVKKLTKDGETYHIQGLENLI